MKQIAEWFDESGITLYYVGGCVRDEIMGNPVEDVDICMVGGRTAHNVGALLSVALIDQVIDGFTTVHGSFPIWIVDICGTKYEFAMARKERKSGQSRIEFECEVRDVTIQEDLYRRDLTINAIAKNVLTGEIIDPYEGVLHIQDHIAHPVSEAFKEDSLRVYRAARFTARFDLYPSPTLLQYCKELKPNDISNERVGMELRKAMVQASEGSTFFNFLREVGWLGYHFKELEDCIDVPQDPKHHPEGDVYTHTMLCMDATKDPFLRVVMLCHDLGKATKTEIDGFPWTDPTVQDAYNTFNDNVKISSAGHEAESAKLCVQMLQRINYDNHRTIRNIACLVELHMIRSVISSKNYDKIIRRTLRKLMHHHLQYSQLIEVIHLDLSGRLPLPQPSILDVSTELYATHAHWLATMGHMEPIVTGEVLLAEGIEEGPDMGKIINKALELQDRGTLKKHNWKQVLHGAGFKQIKIDGKDTRTDIQGETRLLEKPEESPET